MYYIKTKSVVLKKVLLTYWNAQRSSMGSTSCIWIMVLLLNCVFCDNVSTPLSRELLTSNENSNRILSEADPSPLTPLPPLPADFYYVDDPRFTVYYEKRLSNPNAVSCTQLCANTVYGICDDSVQPNSVNTAQKMTDLVSNIENYERNRCDQVLQANSAIAPYINQGNLLFL